MVERRGAYKVLVGNLRERDHLEDLGMYGGDDIKMNLHKIGWKGLNWIYLAQNRGRLWDLVNAVMNLQVP